MPPFNSRSRCGGSSTHGSVCQCCWCSPAALSAALWAADRPSSTAGFSGVNAAALAVPAFALETFTDEAKAQQHCPKDIVVWLNLPTMIWHYKGQRWYANGAYACEKEAGAVGRGGRGMGSNSGLKIARKIAGDRIPRFSGNSYTGVRSGRISDSATRRWIVRTWTGLSPLRIVAETFAWITGMWAILLSRV